LVADKDIGCDFEVVGRFHAAHNEAAFRRLADGAKRQVPGLETEARIVPQSEQHKEIGTDAYHGGAEAMIATHRPVTAIERNASAFTLSTPKGPRDRAGI
jgi:hypothetical protein